jgi:flavorubredoxin
MISRISQVIDPSKIDYIICNHLEIDHSGSLPKLMNLAKNAKVITSLNGEKLLKAHFDVNEAWDIKAVKSGETLLNNNMLPTVAAFLQYMKGLSPKNRKALVFGSYGWGGQSVTQVEEVLKSCGFEVLESIRVQFVPSESTIEEITEKVYQSIGNMG